MKKFVYIEAMSLSQHDLVDKMEARRKKLAEHLAKCAMYGDGLGAGKYNHWVNHEIATYISEINEITVKPKGNKLKQSKYVDKLFGLLGDDKADARSALIDLQLYNSSKDNPYPEVEIDDAMVERMYLITQEMIGKIAPVLSTKNNFNKNDIEKLLHNVLDPICLGVDIWK